MRSGLLTTIGSLALIGRGLIFTGAQTCRGGPLWLPRIDNSVSQPNHARDNLSLPLRVAVIGFIGDGGAGATGALRSAMEPDDRVSPIEPGQIRPAVDGVGYSGSINMTLEEARKLGAAIGCDFFIVGKAEALTRSEQKRESHGEAVIGVMVIDGRSGSLAHFHFIRETSPGAASAMERATAALASCARGLVDKMEHYREQRMASLAVVNAGAPKAGSPEPIEDMPDEGSPRSAGFAPPQFLNRVKPEYTAEADIGGIAATVEAFAVFKSNGEVGEIEINRWAGYGLDEAAQHAIRSLKFKPATRYGRAISVRAMIRYNFKVSSQ